MDNALATSVASLTKLQSTSMIDFSKYGTESKFLPRLQLITKGKYVNKQLIAPGHYGVPNGDDDITDLGEGIDVLVLACREKALDTTQEPPLSVFDPNDEVFKEIVERSFTQDSGCMWGPSFLLFERNTGSFYEFFCGNVSARNEASLMGQHLPVTEEQAAANGVEPSEAKQFTLRAKYIERGRHSWHAPVVCKCSTPITNLPSIDVQLEQINKFLNPKTNGPEIGDEDEAR